MGYRARSDDEVDQKEEDEDQEGDESMYRYSSMHIDIRGAPDPGSRG